MSKVRSGAGFILEVALLGAAIAIVILLFSILG